MKTIALDIYGTLIDTAGVASELKKFIGDADMAMRFTAKWRDKQLEYTFRYGLMDHYINFRLCTRYALDYCCSFFTVNLTDIQRQQLMDFYLKLPAFDDIETGLEKLHHHNIKLFAFSNGLQRDVNQLLIHAGIDKYFTDIISVDEVKTFKPNPLVYQHFLHRAKSDSKNTWLISSNAFDICGAAAIGMNTLWLNRNPKNVFDPGEFTAMHEVPNFTEAVKFLLQN